MGLNDPNSLFYRHTFDVITWRERNTNTMRCNGKKQWQKAMAKNNGKSHLLTLILKVDSW